MPRDAVDVSLPCHEAMPINVRQCLLEVSFLDNSFPDDLIGDRVVGSWKLESCPHRCRWERATRHWSWAATDSGITSASTKPSPLSPLSPGSTNPVVRLSPRFERSSSDGKVTDGSLAVKWFQTSHVIGELSIDPQSVV